MNVAILTRVSKESQSFDRQIADLRIHATKNNYTILGEFNEKNNWGCQEPGPHSMERIDGIATNTTVE